MTADATSSSGSGVAAMRNKGRRSDPGQRGGVRGQAVLTSGRAT